MDNKVLAQKLKDGPYVSGAREAMLDAAERLNRMDELIAVADTAQALLSGRPELDTLRFTLSGLLPPNV